MKQIISVAARPASSIPYRSITEMGDNLLIMGDADKMDLKNRVRADLIRELQEIFAKHNVELPIEDVAEYLLNPENIEATRPLVNEGMDIYANRGNDEGSLKRMFDTGSWRNFYTHFLNYWGPVGLQGNENAFRELAGMEYYIEPDEKERVKKVKDKSRKKKSGTFDPFGKKSTESYVKAKRFNE